MEITSIVQLNHGAQNMLKFCLAAAVAFGIVSGAAFAQSSTTTTTQSVNPAQPVIGGGATDTVTRRSVSSNGVVTDSTTTNTTGSAFTPDGNLATTHKRTETTIVR
jgi:hypothetical protein